MVYLVLPECYKINLVSPNESLVCVTDLLQGIIVLSVVSVCRN